MASARDRSSAQDALRLALRLCHNAGHGHLNVSLVDSIQVLTTWRDDLRMRHDAVELGLKARRIDFKSAVGWSIFIRASKATTTDEPERAVWAKETTPTKRTKR